ncbi:MAG: cyclic beta 1-2 glucan synthetase, partial [Desulfovibrionaceae bacterium]|nr:cyclic beta 1-2 glucan synthetase [Desulfovibrionaceae bacterium]
MDIYACTLAKKHSISQRRRSDRLLSRLTDNEQALGECREKFLAASGSGARPHIGAAGEWLLDNYWLVEEQISAIKKNMPRRYIEELPQLDSGPCAGLPRVYDIVFEHISHNDGHLDIGAFHRFIMAYQSVSPLQLGELWAMPLLLRLALIENLRRISTAIIAAWQDQRLAVQWADIIAAAAAKDGKGLLAIAEMAASRPPLSSAFVAELARCMQSQGANYISPLTWIEELLAPLELDADGLIQQDTRRQAAAQVSISNTLNALRIISAQNWREFVENASLVEQTLRADPAGIYQNMDFATRDHYRHAVEQLARRYRISELELAEKALKLAGSNSLSVEALARAQQDGATEVSAHVGYYLIDEGQNLLQLEVLGAQGGKGGSANPADLKRPRYFVFYLGFTLAVTGLFVWPFFYVLKQNHWSEAGMLLAIIPVLLVTSQLGVRLANWLASGLVPPDFMPRMDYHGGIPSEMRALVVIPAILDRKSNVEKLTERLEVHFLANRDENIQFGLLTDFKDAPREDMPEDFSLLELAVEAIDRLNARYPSRTVDRFFLCHRARVYNRSDDIWMGWERKRGKLSEFNRLLLGAEKSEHFLLIRGNTLKPAQELSADGEVHPPRYVITLDADTQLPRDAACRMVGAMAHPLNWPVFNREGCVVSGYALMQPRVGTTLVSAMQTAYASLLSHDPGVDPYTNAVSDIYQDLFNQGSYVGKGIYDIEAFENALNNRFPDNSILSHDLIEGCFARSGLIADLLLFEDAPASYAADAARRHRWIRGDWQLLPWLMPFIPVRDGKRVKNPLSPLSLWKLGDNLRRSLVAPALLMAFITGWFGTGQPLFWTLALLSLIFALPVFDFLLGLFHKPSDIPLLRYLEAAFNHLGLQLVRSFFTLVWLANEAALSLDAVLRTLWRLLVSRKHMLQWSPSADTERNSPKTLPGNLRNMRGGLLAAGICLAGLYINDQAWGAALPIILLWLAAPLLAWKLSRPRLERKFCPALEDKNFLRRISRRTWAFFEYYVNEENNWLPPDNVQERPELTVAQRTSPTNIGLSMLAHLAAHDFCYLSVDRLLSRLEKTVTSMFRMQRHRG